MHTHFLAMNQEGEKKKPCKLPWHVTLHISPQREPSSFLLPPISPSGGSFDGSAERVYLHPKSPGYVIVCDPAGGRERERDERVTKETESLSGRETCVTAEGKSCAAAAINKPRVERASRARRLRLCPNSHSTASSPWPLLLFLTPPNKSLPPTQSVKMISWTDGPKIFFKSCEDCGLLLQNVQS